MQKTAQSGKTAQAFTDELEKLRMLLEASYIDKGLSPEIADEFSTKEAISTMVKNCPHNRLKTIIEAGNFKNMNEAVAKYIESSTEMTGNASTILFTQRGRPYRGSTYRGNQYGRGNGRSFNHNNGHYSNNIYRGTNRFNGNNRGRGNFRRNPNNNNNNATYTNNSNVRISQNASGNSQQPLGTQQ
ncbi:putative uncharacterized protein DDB_G0286901 [Drosophila eugracilis]|uniref:putative uncharacterized protein DDB_G0286901 n=1 Tax=Drosophila eugracilis TaxID=29029 RepID=UPI001BD9A9DE|nr:putative uncharacterized protein DDB_G0286901 [Drosophila eugracilis]